jgi:hypothetical protein
MQKRQHMGLAVWGMAGGKEAEGGWQGTGSGPGRIGSSEGVACSLVHAIMCVSRCWVHSMGGQYKGLPGVHAGHHLAVTALLKLQLLFGDISGDARPKPSKNHGFLNKRLAARTIIPNQEAGCVLYGGAGRRAAKPQ